MDGSSNSCCDDDESFDLLACCSKCLYEYVVFFSGFFFVCNVWKYVMVVGELYELYGTWWSGVKGGVFVYGGA